MAAKGSLEKRFLSALAPVEGRPLVVAVSGGADSTALMHLAALHADGRRVVVAHFDHGLRAESRDDAAHVGREAARLGLAFRSVRRPVVRAGGESPEAAARTARYAFLAEAAAERPRSVVLTGHHAQDQAETLLLNLMRGTGPDGIAGIAAHATIRVNRGVIEVMRPLLAETPGALRRWLTDRGIMWREDPTNENGNARARLRHRVLPLLDEIFGTSAVPAMARTAALAGQSRAGVDRIWELVVDLLDRTDDANGAARIELSPAQSIAIRRLEDSVSDEFLRRCVARIRGTASSAAETERLRAAWQHRSGLDLRGVRLEFGPQGSASLTRRDRRESVAHEPLRRLFVSEHPANPAPFLIRLRAAPGTCEIADADRVTRPLRVRRPRPGDRFAPLGHIGSPRRLTHFMRARGIPENERAGQSVVVDAMGRILAVAGVGIAKRAAVTPATRSVLVLRFV